MRKNAFALSMLRALDNAQARETATPPPPCHACKKNPEQESLKTASRNATTNQIVR